MQVAAKQKQRNRPAPTAPSRTALAQNAPSAVRTGNAPRPDKAERLHESGAVLIKFTIHFLLLKEHVILQKVKDRPGSD